MKMIPGLQLADDVANICINDSVYSCLMTLFKQWLTGAGLAR
jgi:hypothetical protein